MLKVQNLDAYYGLSHVLQDVALSVEPAETASLLGRNGAGKTTLLHTIMGLHRNPPPKGSITYDEKELIDLPAYKVLFHGIRLVPETREIFPLLTVYENIKIGHISKKNTPGHWGFDEFMDVSLALFPPLKKRLKNKGTQLSGGEQQMLAMVRALGSRPRLLLLDEPTEGLAPIYVNRIHEVILELKRQKVAMLLVTHGVNMALEVSERIFFMEKGRICYEGTSEEVAGDPEIQMRYLGV
jgi:branched-chain amino acid transport system ATP-binding protein